jgi:hypothetical protein
MQNVQRNSEPNSQTSVLTSNALEQPTQVPIALTITHPARRGEYVSGFLHLWAKYVRGFNHNEHCQLALRGPLSCIVKTKSTPVDAKLVLSEARQYDSLYICGVASGSISARRVNNLHLPLQPYLGAQFVYETYNGYLLNIGNALILPTPELPQGWNALPDAYTRCRNFRFCVHRFGYPSEPRNTDALHHTRPRDSVRECSQAGFLGRPLDARLDSLASAENHGA